MSHVLQYPIYVNPSPQTPGTYRSPNTNSYVYMMIVQVFEKMQVQEVEEADLIWRTSSLMFWKRAWLVMAAPAVSFTGTNVTNAGVVLDPAFAPDGVEFPSVDRISLDDNMGWELYSVTTDRDPRTKDGIYYTTWQCCTKYYENEDSKRKVLVNYDVATPKDITPGDP